MVHLRKGVSDQHGTKQRDLKTGEESFILYLFWIPYYRKLTLHEINANR